MPLTDDEIREKYLERAIRELNSLAHEIHGCDECPRGSLMPVLGSGHPQADIFLLKHTAKPAEVEEGVAFYGRAGTALTKSFKRLGIDPLTVYGTVSVKCPVEPVEAADSCMARVLDELMVVQPRVVVIMGEPALDAVAALEMPGAAALEPRAGEIQQWTAHCDALFTPDLDECLDDESAKRAFWDAFKGLGVWHAQLPPF
ncbi:MAG: uracil-DNA glycosylase [Actinobacteria bacterium]|nr:uracil-DNA glycosylase [Actinomycetota bacterium]